MGVSFVKELVVDRVQIYPPPKDVEKNKLQTRLISKLGESAHPFALTFPKTAPNSVLIRGEEGDAASMGVSYEVRITVGESAEDHKGSKKSTVAMSIRKVILNGHAKMRHPSYIKLSIKVNNKSFLPILNFCIKKNHD